MGDRRPEKSASKSIKEILDECQERLNRAADEMLQQFADTSGTGSSLGVLSNLDDSLRGAQDRSGGDSSLGILSQLDDSFSTAQDFLQDSSGGTSSLGVVSDLDDSLTRALAALSPGDPSIPSDLFPSPGGQPYERPPYYYGQSVPSGGPQSPRTPPPASPPPWVTPPPSPELDLEGDRCDRVGYTPTVWPGYGPYLPRRILKPGEPKPTKEQLEMETPIRSERFFPVAASTPVRMKISSVDANLLMYCEDNFPKRRDPRDETFHSLGSLHESQVPEPHPLDVTWQEDTMPSELLTDQERIRRERERARAASPDVSIPSPFFAKVKPDQPDVSIPPRLFHSPNVYRSPPPAPDVSMPSGFFSSPGGEPYERAPYVDHSLPPLEVSVPSADLTPPIYTSPYAGYTREHGTPWSMGRYDPYMPRRILRPEEASPTEEQFEKETPKLTDSFYPVATSSPISMSEYEEDMGRIDAAMLPGRFEEHPRVRPPESETIIAWASTFFMSQEPSPQELDMPWEEDTMPSELLEDDERERRRRQRAYVKRMEDKGIVMKHKPSLALLKEVAANRQAQLEFMRKHGDNIKRILDLPTFPAVPPGYKKISDCYPPPPEFRGFGPRRSPPPPARPLPREPVRRTPSPQRSPGPSRRSPSPPQEAGRRTPSPQRSPSPPRRSPSPPQESGRRTPSPRHSPPQRSPSPPQEPGRRTPSPVHSTPRRSPSPPQETGRRTPSPTHSTPRRSPSPPQGAEQIPALHGLMDRIDTLVDKIEDTLALQSEDSSLEIMDDLDDLLEASPGPSDLEITAFRSRTEEEFTSFLSTPGAGVSQDVSDVSSIGVLSDMEASDYQTAIEDHHITSYLSTPRYPVHPPARESPSPPLPTYFPTPGYMLPPAQGSPASPPLPTYFPTPADQLPSPIPSPTPERPAPEPEPTPGPSRAIERPVTPAASEERPAETPVRRRVYFSESDTVFTVERLSPSYFRISDEEETPVEYDWSDSSSSPSPSPSPERPPPRPVTVQQPAAPTIPQVPVPAAPPRIRETSPQPSTSTAPPPQSTPPDQPQQSTSTVSLTTVDKTPSGGSVRKTVTFSEEISERIIPPRRPFQRESEIMSRYGTMLKPPRTASTYRPPPPEDDWPEPPPRPKPPVEYTYGPRGPWVYGSTRPPPKTSAGCFDHPLTPAPKPRATSTPVRQPTPGPFRHHRAASAPQRPPSASGPRTTRIPSPATPTGRPLLDRGRPASSQGRPPSTGRPVSAEGRPRPAQARPRTAQPSQPRPEPSRTIPGPDQARPGPSRTPRPAQPRAAPQRTPATARSIPKAPARYTRDPPPDPTRSEVDVPETFDMLERRVFDADERIRRIEAEIFSPIEYQLDRGHPTMSPELRDKFMDSFSKIKQGVSRLQDMVDRRMGERSFERQPSRKMDPMGHYSI